MNLDLLPADDRNACDDAQFPGFRTWRHSLVVCVLTIWAAVELVRWVV